MKRTESKIDLSRFHGPCGKIVRFRVVRLGGGGDFFDFKRSALSRPEIAFPSSLYVDRVVFPRSGTGSFSAAYNGHDANDDDDDVCGALVFGLRQQRKAALRYGRQHVGRRRLRRRAAAQPDVLAEVPQYRVGKRHVVYGQAPPAPAPPGRRSADPTHAVGPVVVVQ